MKNSNSLLFCVSTLLLTSATLSAQNPFLLADISQGTDGSFPGQMVKISDGVYVFVADDDVHGKELWVTDGTSSGTTLLMDVNEGSKDAFIALSKIVVGGKALFRADYQNENGQPQTGLWATDGTTVGTIKLSTADPIFFNDPYHLTYAEMNGILYFAAELIPYSQQLWRSDGTAAGTWQVSSLPQGASEVSWFAVNNGFVYFRAYENSHGRELWKSDGTTAGTSIVKDINPAGDSSPEYVTAYKGKIYFSAYQGFITRLYVSDGTEGGTKLFEDNQDTKITSPYLLKVAGDYLFLGAVSAGKGLELWNTDGTLLTMLKDIFPGEEPSMPEDLTDVNGTLFFSAIDEDGYALWKSDGTETGTVKVIDIAGGITSQYYDFTKVNDELYFAFDNSSTRELWRSDGTACHTQKLDFFEGASDETEILLADGSTLFLSLLSSQFGQEPWKYQSTSISAIEICNGFDDDCDGAVDNNPVVIVDPAGTITECKGIPVTLSTPLESDLSYQWMKNGNIISGATDETYTTVQGGDFQVSVNSFSGCDAVSATTHIDRIALPTATITPVGNPDICLKGFVNLKTSNITNTAYQWYLNGSLLPGATQYIYHATMVGSYKVNVTNELGCSKLSKKLTVYTSCKESDSFTDNHSIEIYPNPVTDVLSIKQQFTEAGQVRIYNTLGQLIKAESFYSSELQLDVATLAKGSYLLQLQTNDVTYSFKFMKE